MCRRRGARCVGVALDAALDVDRAYRCVVPGRRGVTVREVVADESDEDEDESVESTETGEAGDRLAGSDRRLLLSVDEGDTVRPFAIPCPFAALRSRGDCGVAVCVEDVDVEEVDGVGDAVREDVGVGSAEGNLGVGTEGRLLFAASARRFRSALMIDC